MMIFSGKYTFAKIISGSMEPYLMTNSLVLSKECDISEVGIGDVIVYNHECFLCGNDIQIIHRLYYYEEHISEVTGETFYVAKGDNNDCVDKDYVTKENLCGKLVYRFRLLSWIYNFIINNNLHKITIIILLILSLWFTIKEVKIKNNTEN